MGRHVTLVHPTYISFPPLRRDESLCRDSHLPMDVKMPFEISNRSMEGTCVCVSEMVDEQVTRNQKSTTPLL